MGSVEDTIRNISKKYKNVKSPLSENYEKGNKTTHFIQNKNNNCIKSSLLNDFKPNSKSF